MKCSLCCKRYDKMRSDSVIRSRGHLWHAPCATIMADGSVDFPSTGRIIPDTIILPDAATREKGRKKGRKK